MDRLTKVMLCNDGNKLYDYSNEVVKNVKDFSSRLELMFEKLAAYEDLEEQGRLLKLPCKVGNMLYYPEKNFANVVIPIRLNRIHISFDGIDTYSCQFDCCSFDSWGDVYEEYEFDANDLGKSVFLTEEEAKAKLKELRDEINEERKTT